MFEKAETCEPWIGKFIVSRCYIESQLVLKQFDLLNTAYIRLSIQTKRNGFLLVNK